MEGSHIAALKRVQFSKVADCTDLTLCERIATPLLDLGFRRIPVVVWTYHPSLAPAHLSALD